MPAKKKTTKKDAAEAMDPIQTLPPIEAEAMDMPNMEDAESIAGGSADIPMAERRHTETGASYKRSIYALPVNVQVVIGTARPTIAQLLKLKSDSILEMDKAINDPVDLCIDNRVIARGELVETDSITGSLGLKITEIVDIAEDMLS